MNNIEKLVKICLKKPAQIPEIEKFITEHKFGRKAVTMTAIKLCEKGMCAFSEFLYMNERIPNPKELVTYGWEDIFGIFVRYGLDESLVIRVGEESYNFIKALSDLDDFSMGARILRNILSDDRSPFVWLDNKRFSQMYYDDLMFDLYLDCIARPEVIENDLNFLMVLIGCGAGFGYFNKLKNGYKQKDLRYFEKFDYKIENSDKSIKIDVFDKTNGLEVLQLYSSFGDSAEEPVYEHDRFKIYDERLGGADFKIKPVKHIFDAENNIDVILESNEEIISIDEDTVFELLYYFLLRFFDMDYKYGTLRYEDEVGFLWYLEENIYTFDDIKRMLAEIEQYCEIIKNDFENPVLNELKSRFSETILNDKNIAISFYENFVKRMRDMMDSVSGFNLISFMGP